MTVENHLLVEAVQTTEYHEYYGVEVGGAKAGCTTGRAVQGQNLFEQFAFAQPALPPDVVHKLHIAHHLPHQNAV